MRSPPPSDTSLSQPNLAWLREVVGPTVTIIMISAILVLPMRGQTWLRSTARWLSDGPSLPEQVAAGDAYCSIDIGSGTASINCRDSTGCTALMWAAQRGDLDLVRQLLAAGADPLAVSTHGFTALGNAATNDHVEIVGLLLDVGVPVDQPSVGGLTARQLAESNGAGKAASLLADRGHVPRWR